MRILIHSTSYPPKISGVAVFAASIADWAARHGHEVLVLTSSGRRRVIQPIAPVHPHVRVVELLSIWNPFHRELMFPIPTRAALTHYLEEFRPDVIHLQDPLPSSVTLAMLARTRGIPVIATHHFSMELVQTYLPAW